MEYVNKLRSKHIYSEAQIKQISMYKGYPVDEWFPRADLNASQLDQIRLGKEAGINVESYDSSFVPADIMCEMRLALQGGQDISRYTKEGFSVGQLREIRLGMADLLEIKDYAHIWFTTEHMKEIRTSMERSLPTKNKIYIFKQTGMLGLDGDVLVIAISLLEAHKQLLAQMDGSQKIMSIPSKIISPLSPSMYKISGIFNQ